MDLRNYFNLIRKWLWLVVLCSVVAGTAAFFISRQQVRIYQSTATVFINQARSSTARADYTDIITSERIARTYAAMLQDWPTLQQAALDLGYMGGLNELQQTYNVAVTVTPVRDTQLVQLSVQSNNPTVAAQLANILPDVFMRMNRTRQEQRFADTREELQGELAASEADLEKTEQAFNQLPATTENSNERDRLERLVTRYQTTYNTLSKSLEDLRLAEAQTTDNIVLTTPAQPASSPIRPRVLFNTLLAALVGALLGMGVAFLIEYLDDTIKTPDQVRDLTGLATLGGVVKLEGATPADRLVATTSARSPSAEAYRVLRTNLQFSSLDKPLATLVITSATPGEGKSTTAANLAIVLAQAEKRVILVDADLRRPSLHKIFRVPNHTGLSTALLDKQHDPAVYLQDAEVPNLRILVTGPIPPNPAEMLSSTRMGEVIETLKGEADVVVFDMPPVLAVADASILASRVDGTVLVVGVGEARGEMLVQAVERLESVGVHPLGVVLNKLTERKSGYYYYYYYQYASRYEADGSDSNEKPGGRGRRRSRSQPKAPQVS